LDNKVFDIIDARCNHEDTVLVRLATARCWFRIYSLRDYDALFQPM